MNKIPKLSICIATFNRAAFIVETLESILPQLTDAVELLVVDGGSTDGTSVLMAAFVQKYPQVKYFPQLENSGVDKDYDKAVGYALGEYCWLMTDDDLLKSGAVSLVLERVGLGYDLVVVNAEVKNADFSKVLVSRQINQYSDRTYTISTKEDFFADCMSYLSFIGAVVIRKVLWLEREREQYYGSLFIHVGVIFQDPPIVSVYLISEPMLVIRYGNAMWTARGFEIWSFKWPNLVWSFPAFSESVKRKVCRAQPWKSPASLFHHRATGAYSEKEFASLIANVSTGVNRFVAWAIAHTPGRFAVFLAVLFYTFFRRTYGLSKFDIQRSKYSGSWSRWLSQILWR